jgi:hypothetical protein
MRKALVIMFAVAVFAVVVSGTFADGVSDNAGCGLGKVLWKGQDSLLAQISAATTNGTSGNQTFGMTSGTSQCGEYKGIVFNEKAENFVAQNMDNLAQDMAQGNGEYLQTLAVLMEVPENDRPLFNSKLQKNFSDIYTSEDVTSQEVVKNMVDVLNS